MEALHITPQNPNTKLPQTQKKSAGPDVNEAIKNLTKYLSEFSQRKDEKSFAEHEAVIARLSQAIGREAIGEALLHYDVSSDVISVGNTYRKKYASQRLYQTVMGPVQLERHIYANRKRDGDGKSIFPLELQSGVIDSYWSPKAAKNCAWVLAHLTPQETENLLFEFGGMMPSKSSLDRLPKTVNTHWESQTIKYHQLLLDDDDIPSEATTMAVSLDGVMIAMKPENKGEKSKTAARCDWHEASAGTVSYYDKDGERLATYQYGRMPESKKMTLKTLLENHTSHALKRRPDLQLVHIADGARDNWTFFDEDMPLGFQVTDFYHACEYLKSGFETAYDAAKAREQFEKYKIILRDDVNGIDKVLRAFRYLRDKDKANETIQTTLRYLANNKHRMKYATAKAFGFPIGSGVVEAACKTLVGQRLKRSGMTWKFDGGQAILTLRGLVKSHRFDKAWGIIADNYEKIVKTHDNVIGFPGQMFS